MGLTTNQKVARSSRAGRINPINHLASRQLAAFCFSLAFSPTSPIPFASFSTTCPFWPKTEIVANKTIRMLLPNIHPLSMGQPDSAIPTSLSLSPRSLFHLRGFSWVIKIIYYRRFAGPRLRRVRQESSESRARTCVQPVTSRPIHIIPVRRQSLQ